MAYVSLLGEPQSIRIGLLPNGGSVTK